MMSLYKAVKPLFLAYAAGMFNQFYGKDMKKRRKSYNKDVQKMFNASFAAQIVERNGLFVEKRIGRVCFFHTFASEKRNAHIKKQKKA